MEAKIEMAKIKGHVFASPKYLIYKPISHGLIANPAPLMKNIIALNLPLWLAGE